MWVEDPLRSVEFFEQVVGLPGVRVDEFRAGQISFPSVRVSDDSLIDLMPRAIAGKMNAIADAAQPGAAPSAGHPVHHVCLTLSEPDFEALERRLEAHGVTPFGGLQRSFGARGFAPRTFYFHDPDGNVLEARYYAAT